MDKVLERHWHVVGLARDLAAPGSVMGATILGQDVVVWRCGDQLVAWDDICVHRGVRLSLGTVIGDRLKCSYHGWEYSGEGRCVKIPAHPDIRIPERARVKQTFRAVEHIGMIWVNLSDDPAPLPMLNEHEEPGFVAYPSGGYPLSASAPRAVENFLDIAHVPFVHDGYLAIRDRPEIGDYTVHESDDGIFAENIVYYQPDPDGRGMPGDYVYDFGVLAPLTVYFRKYMNEPGARYVMVYNVRPVSETECVAYMGTVMNYATDTPYQQVADFQDIIVSQDKPMTESQRPELLPLDLAEELHLKSDKLAIAYRRYLRKLGLSFGTQ